MGEGGSAVSGVDVDRALQLEFFLDHESLDAKALAKNQGASADFVSVEEYQDYVARNATADAAPHSNDGAGGNGDGDMAMDVSPGSTSAGAAVSPASSNAGAQGTGSSSISAVSGRSVAVLAQDFDSVAGLLDRKVEEFQKMDAQDRATVDDEDDDSADDDDAVCKLQAEMETLRRRIDNRELQCQQELESQVRLQKEENRRPILQEREEAERLRERVRSLSSVRLPPSASAKMTSIGCTPACSTVAVDASESVHTRGTQDAPGLRPPDYSYAGVPDAISVSSQVTDSSIVTDLSVQHERQSRSKRPRRRRNRRSVCKVESSAKFKAPGERSLFPPKNDDELPFLAEETVKMRQGTTRYATHLTIALFEERMGISSPLKFIYFQDFC